jgi:dolichol-phosphate mannosyltransferase
MEYKMAIDLAVVMPVYNEEECIVKVLQSWISALTALGMKFRIIVLNDGSSDSTKEALQVFSNDHRIELINKTNNGHGPTILMGYKESVKLADWTFQCDSDDEMKPDSFGALWENRERFDALFGVRVARKQSMTRRFISKCAGIIVRLIYGTCITDVNTPYRLIRSSILEKIVCQIPFDTFAPNIIISGVLCKCGLRIYEQPVPSEKRKTGKVSIVRWKLWKSTAKAFWQTLFCQTAIEGIGNRINTKLNNGKMENNNQ